MKTILAAPNYCTKTTQRLEESSHCSLYSTLNLFMFVNIGFQAVLTFILKVSRFAPAGGPPEDAEGVYLEKRGVLIPVVVLLPSVFPRYPEDGLLVVLPHKAGIFATVHLLDEPLAQLSVPAAPGASVIQLCVHLCPNTRMREILCYVLYYSALCDNVISK